MVLAQHDEIGLGRLGIQAEGLGDCREVERLRDKRAPGRPFAVPARRFDGLGAQRFSFGRCLFLLSLCAGRLGQRELARRPQDVDPGVVGKRFVGGNLLRQRLGHFEDLRVLSEVLKGVSQIIAGLQRRAFDPTGGNDGLVHPGSAGVVVFGGQNPAFEDFLPVPQAVSGKLAIEAGAQRLGFGDFQEVDSRRACRVQALVGEASFRPAVSHFDK